MAFRRGGIEVGSHARGQGDGPTDRFPGGPPLDLLQGETEGVSIMHKRKKQPEVPAPSSGPLEISWDDAGNRVYMARNADGSTRPATEAELAALAQRQADCLVQSSRTQPSPYSRKAR
jgi:hypothetical protein